MGRVVDRGGDVDASTSAPESAWRGCDEPAGDVAGVAAAGRTCVRGRRTRDGMPTAASRPIAPFPQPSAMCCPTTLPPTTWRHCCAPNHRLPRAAARASTRRPPRHQGSVHRRTSRRRWPSLAVPVHVLTRSESAQRLALDLGAVSAGDADEEPPEPLDAAILFAPVGSLVPVALRALDRGGRLAIAGIYLSDIPGLSYEGELFYESLSASPPTPAPTARSCWQSPHRPDCRYAYRATPSRRPTRRSTTSRPTGSLVPPSCSSSCRTPVSVRGERYGAASH